jgi:hypothetical protein
MGFAAFQAGGVPDCTEIGIKLELCPPGVLMRYDPESFWSPQRGDMGNPGWGAIIPQIR